jgi:hypothetical protein
MTSEPRKRAQVLEHLGPYIRHPPVAVFGEILDECFAEFHAALGGDIKKDESPRQHLITRLLYISETTSVSARLSASWALSLPAMSLIRDRYEQTVRFSWLTRQPDHKELVKFIGSYYAKANKVFRNLSPAQRAEFEKTGAPLDEWMTTSPTKEERTYLERWEALPLDAMAAKRDTLPPRADTPLDQETLADLYTPVYRQFSSVTHFDAYGARMLGLHKASSGELVLAPDPWWPAILSMYDALFSLVQCHEALLAFYETERKERFSSLHARWCEACRKITED